MFKKYQLKCILLLSVSLLLVGCEGAGGIDTGSGGNESGIADVVSESTNSALRQISDDSEFYTSVNSSLANQTSLNPVEGASLAAGNAATGTTAASNSTGFAPSGNRPTQSARKDWIKTDGQFIFSLLGTAVDVEAEPGTLVTTNQNPVSGDSENVDRDQIEGPGRRVLQAIEVRVLAMDNDLATATESTKVLLETGANLPQGMHYYKGSSGNALIVETGEGEHWNKWLDSSWFAQRNSRFHKVDVTDPNNASLIESLEISGQIITSETIGDRLYFVSRFYPLVTGTEFVESGELVPSISRTSDGFTMPLVEPTSCFQLEGPGSASVVSADITTVAVLDIETMSLVDSECYLGVAETVSIAESAIYLATARRDYSADSGDGTTPGGGTDSPDSQSVDGGEGNGSISVPDGVAETPDSQSVDGGEGNGSILVPDSGTVTPDSNLVDGGEGNASIPVPDGATVTPDSSEPAVVTPGGSFTDNRIETQIHQFAITEAGIDYSGTGVVPGHLGWIHATMPSRISEKDGYVRVASYSSNRLASGTQLNVTVLGGDSGTLTTVGSLTNDSELQTPDINATAESYLQATRFLGNFLYLSILEGQNSTLKIVALSDPGSPATTGSLTFNGSNRQIMPLDGGHLLAVGREIVAVDGRSYEQGVQLSLIDVTDSTRPSLANSVSIGQRGSNAEGLLDERGITIQPANENHPLRVSMGIDVAGENMPSTDFGVDARDFQGWTYSGLHGFNVFTGGDARIEINGVITAESSNGTSFSVPDSSLRSERSIHVGDVVYYLNGVDVVARRWSEFSTLEQSF